MKELLPGRLMRSCALPLLAAMLSACGTDRDNTLGLALIDERGDLQGVRYVSESADSSADYQSALPPSNVGSAGAIALGARPAAGVVARALLQFDAAGFPPAGTVLDSAFVDLSFQDGIGAADTLCASAHAVMAYWDEGIYDPAAFPTVAAAADTVTLARGEIADTLRVPVTAIAQFWVDRPESSWGLALAPADSADFLLEFAARTASRPPALRLYWKTVGAADTSTTVTAVKDVTGFAKTAAFVPLDGVPGRLALGCGFPAGTLLRFPLPDIGDRGTLNRARLTLFADSTLSDLSGFSIRLQRVTAEPWADDSTSVDDVVRGLQAVTPEAESVSFDVTTLVLELIREGNLGILARVNEPRVDADFVHFHGPDTEVAGKAPVLQVWYTPEQEGLP